MPLNLDVGKIYKTDKYGDIIILEYNSCSDVKVRFVNTGFTIIASMSNIRKGNVKDRLSPTVYGVGVVGTSPTKEKGKTLVEYKVWKRMMQRCYSHKHKELNPAYLNCSTSDNFKNFTFFKEWANLQFGFDKNFDLDKDILGCGSVYHEDVCVFVPREINLLFTKRSKKVKGVSFIKKVGKFSAQICDGTGNRFLGYFENESVAKKVYTEEKVKRIGFLIEVYKGRIDPRVCKKLSQLAEELRYVNH